MRSGAVLTIYLDNWWDCVFLSRLNPLLAVKKCVHMSFEQSERALEYDRVCDRAPAKLFDRIVHKKHRNRGWTGNAPEAKGCD